MDCLQFRRNKLATPQALGQDTLEHLKGCPACQEFSHSVDAFEGELASAVKIPVEPSLARRIIAGRESASGMAMRRYALAASVLLALGIGFGVGYQALAPNPGLVEASVDHVLGEPVALTSNQSVNDQELGQALGLSGARLRGSLARAITYLHDCPVPGGFGKHMVMVTDLGKVTVITMPNQNLRWSIGARHKGLVTRLLPATHGSVAIVAETERGLEVAEAMLKEYVSWRS
jgi:hypothetical protein